MASKRAGSPSSAWPPLNSGLMPTRGAFRSTGSVTVRSMVRPPDSLSFKITSASSGRLVFGRRGSCTAMSALPSASVAGRPFERLAHGRHLLVGEAELVAGKARQIALGELDGDLALDGKAGGRRPVEVAAGELDGAGLLRGERLHGGLELEVEALRHEVLDQERGLGDRGWPWGRCGSWRARCRSWPSRPAPAWWRGRPGPGRERHARVLDAVGAREDDGDGHGPTPCRCGRAPASPGAPARRRGRRRGRYRRRRRWAPARCGP